MASKNKSVRPVRAKLAENGVTKRRAAKPAAANPDTIVNSIHDSTGAHVVVTSKAGATISYPRYGDDKARKALSAIGGSLKALQADLKARPPVKPQARLAQGVDSHNAPHSAKAISDQKRDAKGEKKPAPKAGKNKQPSRGAERNYTLGKTKNVARPDTWRYYMLECIMAHKDTASAKAAHTKSRKYSDNKLDFTWADQKGYIKFTK